MKKQSSLIIKKVKKAGHGGAHGGSWKVAYADFVTAMMAFFLLLWLITMVSDEKRARVSAYFKHFSIYDSGGSSWMDKSSEIFNEAGDSPQKALRDVKESNIHEMEKELKEGIMGKLGDAKDQVVVDTVDGGVRIQMTDKEGSLMFEKGSNKLTPKAKQVLQVIGDNIKKLPNKLAIEGHTDSLQYAGNDYSNWELSTERASSARRELESIGLDPNRIQRVSGFADKDPLLSDNPGDPRNRRISIILKVPYIEDEGKTKKPEPPTASKKIIAGIEVSSDDPGLIVNKFEENLSMIKKEGNSSEKKNSADAGNQSGTSAPPVQSMPQENRNWGPVIKKNEWSPVLNDDLRPVIKNSTPPGNNDTSAGKVRDKAVARENSEIEKPILKNLQIPPVTKEETLPATRPVDPYYSKVKKTEKIAPVQKEETAQAKEEPTGPIVIDELSSPVISKDSLFK